MGFTDVMWHVLNLLAPAAALGAIAAALCKLLWRRELGAVRWTRLAAWGSGAAAVALLGGLALGGRDGRMSTYTAMVLGCAAAMWWVGFRRR